MYNNLGYVYKLKGNYQKALDILNKAIEMNPGYGESYRSRGEVYAEMGEYEKAVADITEFLKLIPILHQHFSCVQVFTISWERRNGQKKIEKRLHWVKRMEYMCSLRRMTSF